MGTCNHDKEITITMFGHGEGGSPELVPDDVVTIVGRIILDYATVFAVFQRKFRRSEIKLNGLSSVRGAVSKIRSHDYGNGTEKDRAFWKWVDRMDELDSRVRKPRNVLAHGILFVPLGDYKATRRCASCGIVLSVGGSQTPPHFMVDKIQLDDKQCRVELSRDGLLPLVQDVKEMLRIANYPEYVVLRRNGNTLFVDRHLERFVLADANRAQGEAYRAGQSFDWDKYIQNWSPEKSHYSGLADYIPQTP